MDVSIPLFPLPPPSLSMGGLKVSTRFFMGPPSRVGADGRSRSGLGWFPFSLYGSRWFGFPFWKGRSEFWISPCAILVYNEVDILVLGEVCDEVLGQEVFECLSSGVQDIAWIDLKHI